MPDLAATESEIRIVRWLVAPGETIERGQMFVEVETDKATMEVESSVTGVLREILCPAGETVAVGDVIGALDAQPIPDFSARSSETTPTPQLQPRPREPEIPAPAASVTPPAPRPGGMFARNRAATAAAKTSTGPDITLSVAQRTAARRLQESKQSIPHFYLQTTFDAAAIVARRAAAMPAKLAWDAFFVRAAARALDRFERLCCRLDGDRLVRLECDAIGVAIDLADNLYVIPITSPLNKSVEQISDDIRGGLEQLREGHPDARRIRPALMTVTNLGMCDVESFIPIINPPEAVILGVGKVKPVPIVDQDGRVGVQQRGQLTLCIDHRVASGHYAGRFLGELVKELEAIK